MIARAQEQLNGQGNEKTACLVVRASVPAIWRPAVLPKRGEHANLVRFRQGKRQARISGLLESGYAPGEVSKMLGVSRHEVDIVSSIALPKQLA